MHRRPLILPALVGALALCGCGPDSPRDGTATIAAPTAGVPTTADDRAPAAAHDDGFDIERVPVSTVELGEFPYITLPAGYSAKGRVDRGLGFARFPFWVQGAPHWVEGRFQLLNFRAEREDAFSQLEVRRNIEAVVRQLGGVELSEGRIPDDVLAQWDDVKTQFNGGLGAVSSNPVVTFLVRHADGNIWIQHVSNTAEAWLVVGQEAPFEATATVLPKTELRQQLDRAGKVALEVNFATDRTEILPASRPQLDQVVELLAEDPALALGVHGHTDDVGDAAHNQRLSEGRARAVVAMLVGAGIDASRLEARGFGSQQPVSDNGSEAGRARNRRVELVKS